MEMLKTIELLKDDILKIHNKDTSDPFNSLFENSEKLSISNDDFKKISLGIGKISEEMSKNELDKFVDRYFNFFSILNQSTNTAEMYTVMLGRSVEYQEKMILERSLPFEEVVMRTFNPLIKYFEKNDFEIEIKKISPYLPTTINNGLTDYPFQIEALEKSLKDKNYGDVCTKSSSLLQSLFKEILNYYGVTYGDNDNFNNLYTEVKRQLKMDQKSYNQNEKDKDLRDFTSKVNSCVVKICELRNIYSSSHGVLSQETEKFNNLPHHHYKLIVDTTKTLCNFLLGTLDYQEKKKSANDI